MDFSKRSRGCKYIVCKKCWYQKLSIEKLRVPGVRRALGCTCSHRGAGSLELATPPRSSRLSHPLRSPASFSPDPAALQTLRLAQGALSFSGQSVPDAALGDGHQDGQRGLPGGVQSGALRQLGHLLGDLNLTIPLSPLASRERNIRTSRNSTQITPDCLRLCASPLGWP